MKTVLEKQRNGEPPSVSYRIRPASPAAHLVKVELSLQSFPSGDLALSMPAWIPGSYMIRDFAKNIVRLGAKEADRGGFGNLNRSYNRIWCMSGD